jgi:hypothetical protein
MTIIDFRTAREKRNPEEKPDPEFVAQDQFGRPMYTYSLDYRFGDSIFSVHIFAYSFEDAEDRIKAMKESLVMAGQVYTTVPG